MSKFTRNVIYGFMIYICSLFLLTFTSLGDEIVMSLGLRKAMYTNGKELSVEFAKSLIERGYRFLLEFTPNISNLIIYIFVGGIIAVMVIYINKIS